MLPRLFFVLFLALFLVSVNASLRKPLPRKSSRFQAVLRANQQNSVYRQVVARMIFAANGMGFPRTNDFGDFLMNGEACEAYELEYEFCDDDMQHVELNFEPRKAASHYCIEMELDSDAEFFFAKLETSSQVLELSCHMLKGINDLRIQRGGSNEPNLIL